MRCLRSWHWAGPLVCLALSCSQNLDEPHAAGAGGSAGSSGGAALGGTAGSASGNAGRCASGAATGGAAGIAGGGGSGGAGKAGANGTSGAGSGGRTSSGGSSAGGVSGGTAGSGGENPNGGVAGSIGGAGGGAGGNGGSSSGASGAAGSGGTAGDGDRCDVANEGASPPASLTLSGNLGTHDPVVIAAHDRYYLFSTGDNIGAKTSSDLLAWQGASEVWSNATRPDWIADEVPGAENLWAPDISHFGGQYHLYYSASTFGCNVSCIGHATRPALDSGAWTDHGSIVCSNPGSSCEGNRPDDWNAIDPNVVVDREGTPWLSFGSFWGGLKLIELDQNGDRAGDTLHSIAARPRNGGALEAPFIVRRCGYYYLFMSWDSCCRGADSTYNVHVGRSESVTGPYVDAEGTELMDGGGTLVLEGGTRWRGPGHNAVIFAEDRAYNVYHSYDANSNGDPILRIAELVWDSEGWPISGGP
ncbi:MAG TPA: arabinan endo-1,5-alpha-L-arabinosidase [Polyangiaceae bacterium]